MLVFVVSVLYCNVTATNEIYPYGHTLSLRDALPIAVGPFGQAAAGDEAVERSGDMVGKAAEQGHVSGLSWIESIDARPIAAWAARKALHRLRAAGSNDMAGAGAPPPCPIVGRYIRAVPA